jgi:hypothetical protein
MMSGFTKVPYAQETRIRASMLGLYWHWAVPHAGNAFNPNQGEKKINSGGFYWDRG